MASVFEYIFNIGGDYTATINGMSTATGEFQAKVDGAQSSIGKIASMLSGFDLIKNTIQDFRQATEAMSARFALPGRHAKSKHEIRINKCFMTERWE